MYQFLRNLENLDDLGNQVAKNLTADNLRTYGAKYDSVLDMDEEEKESFEKMVKKMEEVEAWLDCQKRNVRDIKRSMEAQGEGC